MVVGGAVPAGGPMTTLAAMPLSDEPGDEFGFVPPLPPEDRLWRHPSERAAMRPETAAPVRSSRRRGTRAAVLVATVVVLVVAVTVVSTRTDAPTGRTASAADTGVVDAATYDALHDSIAPAVVHVTAERPDGRVSSTGLLVRRDGHLVTAADPLAGATAITVRTADGMTYNATVVGTDRADDLAVLDIATNDAPIARFDTSRRVDSGESVYVVDRTSDATRLWIANASIDASGQRLVAEDGSVMLDMLRAALAAPRATAASILCRADGTVLGIVTTRSPRPGSSSTVTLAPPGRSVSWATPSTWLVRVAEEIIDTGTLHRAWMGIVGEDVAGGGVVLRAVAETGPAARAGVRSGDVVRTVDGAPVASADGLAMAVRSHHPGDRMRVGVQRDEVTLEFDVVLSEQV